MTTYRPLVDVQAPLAEMLNDPRLRFRQVAPIRCRKCGGLLGQVVDVAVELGDELHHATVPGAVVQSTVFDPDRQAETRDPSGHGKVAVPGKRYPLDAPYVAFIEHSTAAHLPPSLPFVCDQHGTVAESLTAIVDVVAMWRKDNCAPTIRAR